MVSICELEQAVDINQSDTIFFLHTGVSFQYVSIKVEETLRSFFFFTHGDEGRQTFLCFYAGEKKNCPTTTTTALHPLLYVTQ